MFIEYGCVSVTLGLEPSRVYDTSKRSLGMGGEPGGGVRCNIVDELITVNCRGEVKVKMGFVELITFNSRACVTMLPAKSVAASVGK